MSNGIALAFNIPALFGTILLFLCFWIHFFIFTLRVEKTITSFFGDNLRNIYWLRKGKRFFWTLLRTSLLIFIFNIFLYSIFFYIIHNVEVKTDDNLKQIHIITICFIIIIAWFFFFNISSYFIIFIHQKQKLVKVYAHYDRLSAINKVTNFNKLNVSRKNYLFLNKKLAFKLRYCEKKILSKKKNVVVKHSLMLIETYSSILELANRIKKIDNNRFFYSTKTKQFISKKDFVILVNGFFCDAISISNIENH